MTTIPGSSMAEQAAVNRKAEGSSPSLGATSEESPRVEGEEPARIENELAPDVSQVKLPRSKSELKRLSRLALGVHARLWTRDGQIEVGLEKGPAKIVFAKGPTPEIAWMSLVEAARRAGEQERSGNEAVPHDAEQTELRNTTNETTPE